MAKALSQDLRDRVVAAVEGGLSRRGAAARFGVSVSSAIRWHQLAREHGRAVAKKPGGDQRSAKTDVHAEQIMAMLEERGDVTLAELQSGLGERGISVGIGTLWRFFNRHGVTRKKRAGTRSSRTVPTF
jgi:transposase